MGAWFIEHAVAIGSFAGAFGALAAALGLIFSAVQTRFAARSADFDSLLRIEAIIAELEIKQGEAVNRDNPAEARRAQVQIFNRLETLSGAVRHRLISKQSRNYARNFLIDMIALQEHYADTHYVGAYRQGKALEDLSWFSVQHRARIDARKREYQEMDDFDARGGLGS